MQLEIKFLIDYGINLKKKFFFCYLNGKRVLHKPITNKSSELFLQEKNPSIDFMPNAKSVSLLCVQCALGVRSGHFKIASTKQCIKSLIMVD